MYEFVHWPYSCVGLYRFQKQQLYYDHRFRIIPISTAKVCLFICHLFFFEHLKYLRSAASARYYVEETFELLREVSRRYLVGYNNA